MQTFKRNWNGKDFIPKLNMVSGLSSAEMSHTVQEPGLCTQVATDYVDLTDSSVKASPLSDCDQDWITPHQAL